MVYISLFQLLLVSAVSMKNTVQKQMFFLGNFEKFDDPAMLKFRLLVSSDLFKTSLTSGSSEGLVAKLRSVIEHCIGV